MRYRYRFGSARRDALWARERIAAYLAGRGANPICGHCGQPVLPTDAWDCAHVGAPRWAGGKLVKVAHRICNQAHNATVDTPSFWKCYRLRKRGERVSKHPLPAGRRSPISKTFNHGVVPRLTGREKHALMMATRQITPPA